MTSATIITIYDPNPNYGNRLQNYAVQTVIENMGIKVNTVSFMDSKLGIKGELKYIVQKMTLYSLPGDKAYWRNVPPRIHIFEKFNKQYIHTEKIKKIEDVKSTDYYILGSDQVWNPDWYSESELKKDLFLLTFCKPEQKVCFSPSFSIDSLPNEWEQWFKKWLPTFPILGTREESGVRIIKSLTGRDAEVTIDPTLMLDKEEWMKISKKPKHVNCDRKYILTYFLGGITKEIEHDVQEYAKELGDLQIYNLLDYSQPDIYISGPSEFVYLIENAEIVLTDSFHACVFSFLFAKPFLCYDRNGVENSMNSRIETLFSKFDLQRKYVNSGLSNDLLECDYSHGYEQLKVEREKLMAFLKKSMKVQ